MQRIHNKDTRSPIYRPTLTHLPTNEHPSTDQRAPIYQPTSTYLPTNE
ncbi:MAG: hypothetical protein MR293_03025 [Bacteroidales bacterium]|nr:hypothetical protein [Bacteroidales bacterium]